MNEGIHVVLAPEVVTTIFGLPITNTLITSWAVILVLAVVAIVIGRALGGLL